MLYEKNEVKELLKLHLLQLQNKNECDINFDN